ncbi:pectinesterase inhibitor-like [Fagus crenata]
MASLSHSMLFLCVGFLPFLFFHSCSSLPLDPNDASSLVDQVCGQTKDVNFCLSTFNSNPCAATAALSTLEFIILQFSYDNASDNERYIAELLRNTQDPAVKQGLDHCTINYQGSFFALQQSFFDFEAKDYRAVGEKSRIVFENSSDCELEFIEGPTHQSPLTSQNNVLIKLTEITDIIIAMLLK